MLSSSSLLGLLLRLLQQQWSDEVDRALRDAGFGDIRQHHANVFAFVPIEGIQVSELARLARVTKQSMANAVEQLERMGYIERRPDPADRRGRLVVLSERGQAVRPVGVRSGLEVEERWARSLGETELEQLRSRLLELLAVLDRDPPIDD